jgi:hypothetical protein
VAHVMLVYVLPIDLISLVTTAAWCGAMVCLIAGTSGTSARSTSMPEVLHTAHQSY